MLMFGRPPTPLRALALALALTVPLMGAATPAQASTPVAEVAEAADHPWDGHVPRPPIVIVGDAMLTPANGVVAGTGTASDPFVIAGWEIDGSVWAPSTGLFASSPMPPGIFIQGTSAHVVVEDNVVRDNPRAQVWVRNAEHVTVRDNLLERTADAPRRSPYDDGVTLEGVQDVTVQGNTIRLAGEPQGANGIIAVREASWTPPLEHVTIQGNTVRWLGTAAGTVHGVYTNGGNHVTVSGNTLENAGQAARWEAVRAEFTHHLHVEDHDLASPGNAATSWGFRLHDVHDAEVLRNRATGYGTGLHLVEVTSSRVANNTLEQGTWGLRVNRSEDLVLRGNTLTGNAHGLSVRGTHVTDYRHDVDASNTVEGLPARYLVGVQDTTVSGSGAGYLGLVDAVNVTVEAPAAPGPGNGEGVLVVNGEEVTVDAGDRAPSHRAVDVRWSLATRVTNLTGHDALLEGGRGLRLDNTTLTDGSRGVLVRDARFVRVENTTLARSTVGAGVTGAGSVDLYAVEAKGNDVGVRFTDSTGSLHRSSVEFNRDTGAEAVATSGSVSFLDATGTWWGASDGPSGEGPGSGDPVRTRGEGSASLVYDPWLTSEPAVAGR